MRRRCGTTREGQITLRSAGARRGVVWVTAGLTLVALMGMAALTIDLGRMTVASQRAQAVADAAALAAVNQMPDTGLANAGLAAVVAANNDVHPWPQVTINADQDVAHYGPGDGVPGYRVLESNEYAITVTGHVDAEYGFGRLAGLQEMNVVRTAAAMASFGAGYGVISAGQQILVDHSHIEIGADMHSNDWMLLDQSTGHVAGRVTYVNSLTEHESSVEFRSGTFQVEAEDPPCSYGLEDFAPYHDIIAGDRPDIPGVSYSGGNIIASGNVHFPPGVYYCSRLNLDGCGTITGNNVTFVTTQAVWINQAASVDFSAAKHDIVFYSLGTTDAITFNQGGTIKLAGGMCAPNGSLYFDQATVEVANGIIYGWDVFLDAGTSVLSLKDATGPRFVSLIQ